jgi:virginiamycin B lyase
MWFVSQNPSSISRIDGAGGILTRNLASATANPTHITSGAGGALWFTEGASTHAIGRIPATTPLAVADESRTTADSPNAIAAGSDGNLWFTQYSASDIGRMTPAGVATYFPLPTGLMNPEGITAGPDGALWYTTLNPGAVVRIATDGSQQPFPLGAGHFPDEIATGPDGALWFAAGDSIGRMTTDGAVEFFPLPTGVGLNYVAPGPDGNVWFTEENAGMIGRITTPPNATTGDATQVRAVDANANGTVNGHSQATDVAIEYGPEGGDLTTGPARHLGASPADQPVSIEVLGLAPSTAYRYRLSATNQTGTTRGAFGTFTTGPAPSCRVTRTRTGGGTIRLILRCKATDSVVARATVKEAPHARQASGLLARKLLYGNGRARVVKGKARLRIKPKRAARALLASRGQLLVKVGLSLRGGGTARPLKKKVRVRAR